MKLYLVRHGEAAPKSIDPEQRLSEKGRLDVSRVADFLGRSGLRVARVVHSGKPRARETAEILAAAVAPGTSPEARGGLDPNDPTGPLAAEVSGWHEDVMMVGHLPFMGELVTRLVTGRGGADIVTYAAGSVACLEPAGGGGWRIAWMLHPELFG